MLFSHYVLIHAGSRLNALVILICHVEPIRDKRIKSSWIVVEALSSDGTGDNAHYLELRLMDQTIHGILYATYSTIAEPFKQVLQTYSPRSYYHLETLRGNVHHRHRFTSRKRCMLNQQHYIPAIMQFHGVNLIWGRFSLEWLHPRKGQLPSSLRK